MAGRVAGWRWGHLCDLWTVVDKLWWTEDRTVRGAGGGVRSVRRVYVGARVRYTVARAGKAPNLLYRLPRQVYVHGAHTIDGHTRSHYEYARDTRTHTIGAQRADRRAASLYNALSLDGRRGRRAGRAGGPGFSATGRWYTAEGRGRRRRSRPLVAAVGAAQLHAAQSRE